MKKDKIFLLVQLTITCIIAFTLSGLVGYMIYLATTDPNAVWK